MITKDEIRKKLPHGSLADVAKRAGVSKAAVSNFFNGRTKSSPHIEKAALECALEYEKPLARLHNKLQNLS